MIDQTELLALRARALALMQHAQALVEQIDALGLQAPACPVCCLARQADPLSDVMSTRRATRRSRRSRARWDPDT